MESLRKNLSAYTLDDAPEDVRELYKDEFIQLYASSIKCFLICIKLGFISGRSSFAPRLNQIWEAVIQTVSILNKSDYLKFYFRINI